ncbi:hypothetical protein IWZ00DRAFT_368215 [Phyllosticta capitalensis]|uniref:Uncharacterized protein n=1 Tax=Phyllosticta capitalensis TaxID=121624 RepID=A0ABR1YEF7_9PEZI
MNGPNPLLEAPFPPPPPPFEAPATRPTSPPATPGAPSPPFTFYKRMSTPQLAESPPLEFGEPPSGRDHPISYTRPPLSHVSSRESLNLGDHHARDDLSVASAGDAGSVSEALSPNEYVPISPVANAEIDVEEVPEDDAENQMGIEIVLPDGFEEPPADRDRPCNGDDCGIATRFQDLNCDSDELGKSAGDAGERQRRFLQRKKRRMNRRFKRRFSEIEGSDTDNADIERPVDTDDSYSPARRLRRKVDSPANDIPIFHFELQDVDGAAAFPLSASGSISRPPSIVSDSEGWTALPFNAASADIMDVDSQGAGVQLAPPPPAPPPAAPP